MASWRAKLGYNKITGEDQFLTSWRNPDDPSPGLFSLEIDPDGIVQFYLLRCRTQRYWSSGVWDGKTFGWAPACGKNLNFKFFQTTNVNVNFFSYIIPDPSVVASVVLDYSGQMKQQQWDNDTLVAVKKLEGVRQGEKQFRMEVSTIGMIHHVNLVRLQGFCSEGARRLLVYDYAPNGSLDAHLFQNTCNILDWGQRYQITLGIARGLEYLHDKCRECIVHCDIKPENILLDELMCPKLADFGMAKLIGREHSRVLTTMRGTLGYLAPEWILGSAITPKADVYSFGMMLLEIISGRRNSEILEGEALAYFPVLVATRLHEGDVLSSLDHRLGGMAKLGELNRACRVACWCIQDQESCRLQMGKVVQILEGALDVSTPPIPKLLWNLTFLDSLATTYADYI